VKNFLKSDRHSHKDPQVRIDSLQDIDASTSEGQSIIDKLASDDTDNNVRLAAINILVNLPLLSRFMSGVDGTAIAQGAEARVVALLADNAVAETQALALLESQQHTFAPMMANHSASEKIRNEAINKITDEATLLKVVQQSRFHDARMSCASRLSQHDNIKAAQQSCRNRDKVVAKMLQQQLDEKAAAEAAEIAAVHAVTSTKDAIRALADSVWSPQTAGKLQSLKHKWNSFDAPLKSDYDVTFANAVKRVQTLIDEHTKTTEEASTSSTDSNDAVADNPTTTNQSDTDTVVAKPDPERDALLAMLSEKSIAELDSVKPDTTPETGTDAHTLWSHATSVAVMFDPPYDLAKGRPAAIKQRLKRIGTLLNTDQLLPGVDMSRCKYMVELQEHHTALRNRLEKAEQESRDRVKATHRQFGALNALVAEGKWGPANSMFRRIKKKVDAMETAERNQIDDKLSLAEKKLDEMADWQDFAARPKLEALCVDMESLPAKSLKPEALAKEVKSLQSQWKALGASRASNDLWARFKAAGDTAYEPCKAYFEQKHAERQTKIDTKIKICDELEKSVQEIDWSAPDWKKIQRKVSDAKRDWSKNRVQDRKPDPALEERFSHALKPFEEKLNEQYDANVLEKKALIEKVSKLAEGDINQHSANQAKRLLSAWKLVGIVRRKDDQALWEEFNGHLRTIYKHQSNVKREQYQASMSHVFRAREIVKTLRAIAKGSNYDEAQIQALQAEFQALDEFPDKDKKFLLRDFRGALDACSKLQANASKQRAKAERSEVQRLVELCEQLEAAVENPSSANENLCDDIAHAWESGSHPVPREMLAKLNSRRNAALAHLEAGTQFDYVANETQRREILIRMEILTEKETPAEDKSLRMQYQLAHLSEGMTSSAVLDKKSALAELEREWMSAGPVAGHVKDALQSRYLAVTGH
jgi:hypothetical protein